MISLSAYAKRRGVSKVAVSKAVAAGRLRESVCRDERGAPKIRDVELADREWAANTVQRADHAALAAPPPRPQHAPAQSSPDAPSYHESRALREAAAARREAAQADLAEMDVLERRGELIPAATARADVIDVFTRVRTRLMGVPSRLAQRLPHLASEVVPAADALIREALEELAGGGADVG